MPTILLGLVFVTICLLQWYFSKNSPHFLCYLPTAFYLVVAAIVSVRLLSSGADLARGFSLLVGALMILLMIDLVTKFLMKYLRAFRSAQRARGKFKVDN